MAVVKRSKLRRLSLEARRASVVSAALRGENLALVARDHGLSLRTAQRYVELYKRSGSVYSPKRPGRPRKITKAVKVRVRAKLRAGKPQSVRSLQRELRDVNVRLSLGSTYTAMKEAGFRSVRPQRKPALTEDHKTARLAWAKAHVKDDSEEVRRRVYSDEKLFVAGRYSRRVWIGADDPIPTVPTSKISHSRPWHLHHTFPPHPSRFPSAQRAHSITHFVFDLARVLTCHVFLGDFRAPQLQSDGFGRDFVVG